MENRKESNTLPLLIKENLTIWVKKHANKNQVSEYISVIKRMPPQSSGTLVQGASSAQ